MARPTNASRIAKAIRRNPQLAERPENRGASVAMAMITEVHRIHLDDPVEALEYAGLALRLTYTDRRAIDATLYRCRLSELWRRMGCLCRILDRYAHAERFHRWGLYWARRADCAECEADSLRRTSLLRIFQLNEREARELSTQCIDKYQQSGGKNVGRGYTAQGFIGVRTGRLQEALDRYEQALEKIPYNDRYFFILAIDGYSHCALRIQDMALKTHAIRLLHDYNSQIPDYYEEIRIRIQVVEAILRRQVGRIDNFHLRRKIFDLLRRMVKNEMERYTIYLVADLAEIVAATEERYRDNIEGILLETMAMIPVRIKKIYRPQLERLQASLAEIEPVHIVAAAQALRAAQISSKIEAFPGTVLESRPQGFSLPTSSTCPSSSHPARGENGP